MSLMRGPQVEEPVVEIKEEEKWGSMRKLPALPPPEDGKDSQLIMHGSEGSKEDGAQ